MIDDESPKGANRKSNDDGADGYDVGYGKPPVHFRFKPGQSGNPKGKAKGQKSARSLIYKIAFEQLSVNTAKGTKRMPAIEAVLRQLMARAAKGDARAATELIKLVKEIDPRDDAAATFSKVAMAALSEEDMAILKRHDRHGGGEAR